jgi:hypothetical protein
MATSDVPGPAAYHDQVLTAFNNIRSKTTSLKRNPFNQTSPRFMSSDRRSRRAPGPGQYRISSFTDASVRRSLIGNKNKAPFNTSSVRLLPIVREEERNMPGKFTSIAL